MHLFGIAFFEVVVGYKGFRDVVINFRGKSIATLIIYAGQPKKTRECIARGAISRT
jgi:hypothetical protein